jgi:hypothetical protein
MRVARPIQLNEEQRKALEQCARSRSRPARTVERSRIVLLAAAGKQDAEIAEQVGTRRRRWLAGGRGFLRVDWLLSRRTLLVVDDHPALRLMSSRR